MHTTKVMWSKSREFNFKSNPHHNFEKKCTWFVEMDLKGRLVQVNMLGCVQTLDNSSHDEPSYYDLDIFTDVGQHEAAICRASVRHWVCEGGGCGQRCRESSERRIRWGGGCHRNRGGEIKLPVSSDKICIDSLFIVIQL